MHTHAKRIADLERRLLPTDKISTIIRRFESPGKLDAELVAIEAPDGVTWRRRGDETEDQLVERASTETKRNAHGVAVLHGITS